MAERKQGITVHMTVDRRPKIVEYPEATYAREDKGSLVLVKAAEPGVGGAAEVLGSIAKGSWTRWHYTSVIVSEPADPVDLDES